MHPSNVIRVIVALVCLSPFAFSPVAATLSALTLDASNFITINLEQQRSFICADITAFRLRRSIQTTLCEKNINGGIFFVKPISLVTSVITAANATLKYWKQDVFQKTITDTNRFAEDAVLVDPSKYTCQYLLGIDCDADVTVLDRDVDRTVVFGRPGTMTLCGENQTKFDASQPFLLAASAVFSDDLLLRVPNVPLQGATLPEPLLKMIDERTSTGAQPATMSELYTKSLGLWPSMNCTSQLIAVTPTPTYFPSLVRILPTNTSLSPSETLTLAPMSSDGVGASVEGIVSVGSPNVALCYDSGMLSPSWAQKLCDEEYRVRSRNRKLQLGHAPSFFSIQRDTLASPLISKVMGISPDGCDACDVRSLFSQMTRDLTATCTRLVGVNCSKPCHIQVPPHEGVYDTSVRFAGVTLCDDAPGAERVIRGYCSKLLNESAVVPKTRTQPPLPPRPTSFLSTDTRDASLDKTINRAKKVFGPQEQDVHVQHLDESQVRRHFKKQRSAAASDSTIGTEARSWGPYWKNPALSPISNRTFITWPPGTSIPSPETVKSITELQDEFNANTCQFANTMRNDLLDSKSDGSTSCKAFDLQCALLDLTLTASVSNSDNRTFGTVFLSQADDVILSSHTYMDFQMRDDLCVGMPDIPVSSTAVRYYVPLEDLNRANPKLFTLSAASCHYKECSPTDIANAAMPDLEPTDFVLGVYCNVTQWDMRLRRSSIDAYLANRKLFFPPLELPVGSIAGTVEFRPVVPNVRPGTVSWTSLSSVSVVNPQAPQQFTDELGLTICRGIDPDANFVQADAIISKGLKFWQGGAAPTPAPTSAIIDGNATSSPAPPVTYAPQVVQTNDTETQPLTTLTTIRCRTFNDTLSPFASCSYNYYQSAVYAAPDNEAVALRCNTAPQPCPLFDNFEVVGAFCGVNGNSLTEGKILWLSANENGVMATMLDPTLQPYEQTNLSHPTYSVPLEGYNCRLGHGWEGHVAWANLLDQPVNGPMVWAQLSTVKNPITGADDAVVQIMTSRLSEPQIFYTCNSCPSSASVGQYCATFTNAYLTITSVDQVDIIKYYDNRGDRLPACYSVFHLQEALPGQPCQFALNRSGLLPSEDPQSGQVEICDWGSSTISRSLEFDVESSTIVARFSDVDGGAPQPYTLCKVDPPSACPLYLDKPWCGVSEYNDTHSLRVSLKSNNMLDLIFRKGEEEPTFCNDLAYIIRNATNGIGCLVEIPAFFNYSGCIANTTLFGQAQGNSPIQYDPVSNKLLFNLLDDTFYLKPCSSCKVGRDEAYCSIYGVDMISISANGSTYNLQPIQPLNEKRTPLGSSGPFSPFDQQALSSGWRRAAFEEVPTVDCLYYLKGPSSNLDYRSLYFDQNGDIHVRKPVIPAKALTQPILDTYLQCTKYGVVKPNDYCSSSGEFDYKISIFDRLNLAFTRSGKSIPSSYRLLDNNVMNLSRVDWPNLVADDEKFERLAIMVYLGEEEGILALLHSFGYVRFEPCTSSSLIQSLGYAAIGLFIGGILGYLCYRNLSTLKKRLSDARKAVAEKAAKVVAKSKDGDGDSYEPAVTTSPSVHVMMVEDGGDISQTKRLVAHQGPKKLQQAEDDEEELQDV